MKRFLSIALAAVILCASLASCAGSPKAIASASGANVRLTSSDALDAAAWLDARLGGRLTERVVLGTDASGYGVTLDALEDDGYVIRRLGDEAALFARTTDGLDRAVRRYAKAVESGAAVEDETYHEGYRVKRIEIAGRDIAEYTIYCENEPNMLAAAEQFADRIAEANGAALPISTAAPAAPYISLRYVRDKGLKNVGYRWSVSDEGISFECSDAFKDTSAEVALTRFLVNRLDGFGLDFGFEDLTPAEYIGIEAGERGGETPCFDWARSTSGQFGEQLDHYGLALGVRIAANAGVAEHKPGASCSVTADSPWNFDQPCWLDEEFYEESRSDLIAYIDKRLGAGQVIGEDFVYIDIAQGDNRNWCRCQKCLKKLREEGSMSGVVLTWANRITEEMNESYPGLVYYVMAYNETRVPPKVTFPNDLIYMTYAFNHPCSSHTLDGTHCTDFGNWPNDNGLVTRNDVMAEQVKTWAKLTKKLTVWTYGSCDGLMSMNYVHTARDDMRFLYESGVAGHYGEGEDNSFDPNWIARWLEYELYWDTEMSDGRYEALRDRITRILYGEGYDLVREYVDLHGMAFEYWKCTSCYHAYAIGRIQDSPINKTFIAKNYDLMFDLMERAISLADSAFTQKMCEKLQCCCIFQGSIASFEAARDAEDAARLAVINERYALIAERLSKYGIDFCATAFPDMNPHKYYENLEDYFD